MKRSQKEIQPGFFIILVMTLIFLHLLNCDIDHGLEPTNSKIAGKIFFRGEIPSHTDEVRVAVVKDFPPKDIKQIIFSDMLDFQKDTAEYEIFLSEGTYDVAAVVWKEENQSWNLCNIIGVYGASFYKGRLVPTFKPVMITHNNPILDNVDIEANLDRVNRDAKIIGTLHFVGSWPENTGVIGVGAFIEIPEPENFIDYYLKSIFIDYSISTFEEKSDYLLRVNSSDTLKYIAALWIDNTFSLASAQDVGFYVDSEDTTGTVPGTVIVPKDSTLTGIDITVDFSKMQGN